MQTLGAKQKRLDGTQTIRLSPKGTGLKRAGILVAAVAVFLASTWWLGLDLGKFFTRLSNAPAVLGRMMALDFSGIGEILAGVGISVSLAVCALSAAFVIAVPVSFLAAENITPNRLLGKTIKAVVAVVRAIPSLVWVLMVVASIGFGNTGGVIGLVFPATGYLIKSFTTSIEGLGGELIEALRSTGASWLDIVTKGLLPTVWPAFMTWLAVRVEANLAESISLGMIGVAGIGLMLNRSISAYDYAGISTIILVIFCTMFLVEMLTTRIRNRLNER